jgi:hypothetical protein
MTTFDEVMAGQPQPGSRISGEQSSRYRVAKIHYRDLYGALLWEEPMVFRRLYATGDVIVHDGGTYIVRRVALADDIQHINMTR